MPDLATWVHWIGEGAIVAGEFDPEPVSRLVLQDGGAVLASVDPATVAKAQLFYNDVIALMHKHAGTETEAAVNTVIEHKRRNQTQRVMPIES